MKTYRTLAIGGALAALSCSASAAELALAHAPLSVSTYVEPNVMLLIDTSGSMDSIIWAEGYDDFTSYPDWGQGYESTRYWIGTENWNYLYNKKGSCDSGWIYGNNGTTTKCLKLPNPVPWNYTRYSGNYLNYLFETYTDGTDLTQGQIPNDYRMNVARNVTTTLINQTPGMRFGLSSFDGGPDGGLVRAGCGGSTATLTTTISNLYSSSWTPLAETYYEVTRYFRGLSGYYSDENYTSPVRYRCQKNFVIVVSDGLPTHDTIFPTDDPDDPSNCGSGSDNCLPNWDQLAPATTSSQAPDFPQYSDGFQPETGDPSKEGYSLYLDDLAKFGHDIDLRGGNDLDDSGESFDASDFPQQNLYTYTVGFSTSNQMLEDAAEYGIGRYYTADDSASLTTSLKQALVDIEGRVSSAAAVAANTGFISANSRIYQGRFNSEDWRGQLLAFAIDADTGQLLTNGNGPDGSLWDAGQLISGYDQRVIVTSNGSSATPFRWNNITTTQQGLLQNSDILNYLRGDHSQEQRLGGSYRNRDTKLGDISHSAPVYVGAPAFRYPDNWGNSEPEQGYSQFKETYKNRTDLVYVGANDGMLHAFDANSGAERFAYIPSTAYTNLASFASPDYQHRFFVDGTPTMGDAYVDGAWHTYLSGGLGHGGQSIYLLDITNPNSFTTEANASTKVLPEFTDAIDNDLGYTYSRPAIARMHNGKWALIFGNGYNNTENDAHTSNSGHAVLYIAFIENGLDGWQSGDFIKLDTGAGNPANPNGLATAAPVDLNGDHIVDTIYAGDLQGNMWKFDVSSSDTDNWRVAFGSNNPEPLFTTPSGQAITAKPEVGRARSKTGVMVYFGSGKYLETTDIAVNIPTQTFYGVWDRGTPITDNTLLMQSVEWQGNFSNQSGSYDVRVTSKNTMGEQHQGWYLNLPDLGERQVSDPMLRSGRIIFTTLIPSTATCSFGGTGWLMELNAYDGSRLDMSPFDFFRDGSFDSRDLVTIPLGEGQATLAASGRKSTVGIINPPKVLNDTDKEFKYASGSSSNIEVITENPGNQSIGRQSWRQLR